MILSLTHKASIFCLLVCLLLNACASSSSIPGSKHDHYKFPPEAMIGATSRPYEVLGEVKSKVDYQLLGAYDDEDKLCQNYFNQAVQNLVKMAKSKGGDAVIDVKSVVFLVDGRQELYPRAECADEGGEAQVLARGIAIRWKSQPK